MTEEEMLTFANNSFPDLPIRKVQTNHDGWDNDILILNEELVFRFPKSTELLSKIKDEGKILEAIKARHPLLITPVYEYLYENKEVKGVTYNFLEGISLSQFTECNLRRNPANAQRVGDFLTKLHSIEMSELESCNIGTTHTIEYWEDLYSNVKSVIFPCITLEQQDEISKVFHDFFAEFKGLTPKDTIIHGDLTASNIIYSKEKECITGIIDFTDVQIGDPAFDFAGLYWAFGIDFTIDVLKWYSSDENQELLLNRVKKFYGLQPVFHNLLYAVENNQKTNWSTALNKFSMLNELSR